MKDIARKHKIGDHVFTYTEGQVLKRTIMLVIEETAKNYTSVSYHLSRTSGATDSGSYPILESYVFDSVQDLVNNILNSPVRDEPIKS